MCKPDRFPCGLARRGGVLLFRARSVILLGENKGRYIVLTSLTLPPSASRHHFPLPPHLASVYLFVCLFSMSFPFSCLLCMHGNGMEGERESVSESTKCSGAHLCVLAFSESNSIQLDAHLTQGYESISENVQSC